MLLDLRRINFEDERDDPLLAQEANEAAGEFETPTKSEDLDRWERKALRSLKRFHTAAVKFESGVIPPSEQTCIREALESATTADEVKAIFQGKLTPEQREVVAERVGDVGITKAVLDERAIEDEWDAAMEWAKQVVE